MKIIFLFSVMLASLVHASNEELATKLGMKNVGRTQGISDHFINSQTGNYFALCDIGVFLDRDGFYVNLILFGRSRAPYTSSSIIEIRQIKTGTFVSPDRLIWGETELVFDSETFRIKEFKTDFVTCRSLADEANFLR